MEHRLLLMMGIVVSLISCAGIPHEVTETRYIEDSFGFCHAGREGSVEKDFIASFGADMVRQDIYWRHLQPQPGDFDFSYFDKRMAAADDAGVGMLGILDYDTPWLHDRPKNTRQVDQDDLHYWLAYVEAVAKRYGNRVTAFEVWNEPNYNLFWTGTDEDFFKLTIETVKTLNRVSPDTPVLVGALVLNPLKHGLRYLKKFLASGAADGADGISVHCYGLSPMVNARRLAKAQRIMDSYGFSGELWITEMGIPTDGWYPHAVSPEKQGSYAAKWIASAYAAGADRIVWYCMYDTYIPGDEPEGTTSEDFFGIAYRNYELKYGGEVMQRLVPDLTGSYWKPDLIKLGPGENLPVVIYPFDMGDSQAIAVAWSRAGSVTASLDGFSHGAVVYDTLTGEEWVLQAESSLIFTPHPLIIKGQILP